MCVSIRQKITLSIIFDKNDEVRNRTIILISEASPGFLIKGITIEDLQDKGKTLVDKQRLTICKITSIIL